MDKDQIASKLLKEWGGLGDVTEGRKIASLRLLISRLVDEIREEEHMHLLQHAAIYESRISTAENKLERISDVLGHNRQSLADIRA